MSVSALPDTAEKALMLRTSPGKTALSETGMGSVLVNWQVNGLTNDVSCSVVGSRAEASLVCGGEGADRAGEF